MLEIPIFPASTAFFSFLLVFPGVNFAGKKYRVKIPRKVASYAFVGRDWLEHTVRKSIYFATPMNFNYAGTNTFNSLHRLRGM